MQTANKPENNNNSHEAHPSLGKLCRKCGNPQTEDMRHENMVGAFACNRCYDAMTEAEYDNFCDCTGRWKA